MLISSLCYLGRPSHMTHEGDQLASKSLSWVWGSSSSWSCSSTMLTSSTRSCTEGEAALAFNVPTASLWLRYVKSCPLILSRTSPEGARGRTCCWRAAHNMQTVLVHISSRLVSHLVWFVHLSTSSRVVGRWSQRLAAPRSYCPSLLQQSYPETRVVPSSQWCVSPYRTHTGKGPVEMNTGWALLQVNTLESCTSHLIFPNNRQSICVYKKKSVFLTLWVLVRDRCMGTGLGVELWLGRKWSRQ